MMPLRLAVLLAVPTALAAQVTPEQFAAIKQEGLEKSHAMAFLDHLVNRIGPRLTSSDNLTDAAEWARDTFQSFGIADAHRAAANGNAADLVPCRVWQIDCQ